MLYGLVLTALLMGAGGLLHCGAMCAMPCAAALPGGVPVAALLGRSLGYALLGALAASAMGMVAAWSRWALVLQPLWVMLLAAVVLLGGWMVLKGTLPAQVQQQGLRGYRDLKAWVERHPRLSRHAPPRWAWPLVLGMAWAALPCGLLYGAVTVAALSASPVEGALVMLVFSLPGGLALWWFPRRLGPWSARTVSDAGACGEPPNLAPAPVVPVLWQPIRLLAQGTGPSGSGSGATPSRLTQADLPRGGPWRTWMADPRWAIRLSGAMLCLAAGWALAQRLQAQWSAWCV